MYVYERPSLPQFAFDRDRLSVPLAAARHLQGRLLGRMEGLGFLARAEATLLSLTDEVLTSTEIEGETLDRSQVRSSIARRLGIEIGALVSSDRNVDGVVAMTLDATQKYDEPVTADRLFGWHAALFPTGRSGVNRITVGAWRDDRLGPMQVVSGRIGSEYVHYQAPPASEIDREMEALLAWLAEPTADLDPVVQAAIAHLWFVTIHPFDDGNGRIARALTDLILARSEGTAQRFYSMSRRIRDERSAYYDQLEAAQKGDLDVTAWIGWFLRCFHRALEEAEGELKTVLTKATFWETNRQANFNERQKLMLNKLLDGFEGKLTTSKWANITKTSADTALRDIRALVDVGILRQDESGGRSTSYSLTRVTK